MRKIKTATGFIFEDSSYYKIQLLKQALENHDTRFETIKLPEYKKIKFREGGEKTVSLSNSSVKVKKWKHSIIVTI